MAKKPTTGDAQLILHLYDLRREAEMRKARKWWGGFWPQGPDDFIQVLNAYSTPENAWLRQVLGYWDMAASLVLRGALNEDLFFDCGNEMWFTLNKVYPFLKELRAKSGNPEFMLRVEKLATKTKEGRERMKKLAARFEKFRTAQAEKVT